MILNSSFGLAFLFLFLFDYEFRVSNWMDCAVWVNWGPYSDVWCDFSWEFFSADSRNVSLFLFFLINLGAVTCRFYPPASTTRLELADFEFSALDLWLILSLLQRRLGFIFILWSFIWSKPVVYLEVGFVVYAMQIFWSYLLCMKCTTIQLFRGLNAAALLFLLLAVVCTFCFLLHFVDFADWSKETSSFQIRIL